MNNNLIDNNLIDNEETNDIEYNIDNNNNLNNDNEETNDIEYDIDMDLIMKCCNKNDNYDDMIINKKKDKLPENNKLHDNKNKNNKIKLDVFLAETKILNCRIFNPRLIPYRIAFPK